MRYPCFQCEHAATTAAFLKIHVENRHEGVIYACDVCDFVATKADHLKRYIDYKLGSS